MKKIYFSDEYGLVGSSNDVDCIKAALDVCRKNMEEARAHDYQTEYASLNVLDDTDMMTKVVQLVHVKKQLPYGAIILVGIGGSSLGTLAVAKALWGLDFERYTKVPLYVADTVDAREIQEILSRIKMILEQSPVLLIIVSKSGSTTETVCNAAVFLDILSSYYPKEYRQYVVAITDRDSVLWKTGEREGWSLLEVPRLVGGRYSVFSPVGLFPLLLLGLSLDDFIRGACQARADGLNKDFASNPAMRSALFLLHHYEQGCEVHDTFLFRNRLEGFGGWYRQLMAESLGKKNSEGVYKGYTPTISVSSNDLHSMIQLYLGGLHNRCTTFVWADENLDIAVPLGPLTNQESGYQFLEKATFNTVMQAIFEGVCSAYVSDRRPFVTFSIEEISASTIGYLMQLKMIEIMYVGYYFKVNSFDQPDVEKYKIVTRKLLHEARSAT